MKSVVYHHHIVFCDDVFSNALELCLAGPQCTEDVDECRKNPCQNRGRCQNTPGNYVCKCQPGYGGLNCQKNIDDCSPSEYSCLLPLPLCIPLFHYITSLLHMTCLYQPASLSFPVCLCFWLSSLSPSHVLQLA